MFSFQKFEIKKKNIWQEPQVENYFCDMTLVCEDTVIRTHKTIVSTSSPLLSTILKENLCTNPIIYISGIKYKYLENLIHFIYECEVFISYKDLHSFLEVAKDFKVRQL